jgi:hypothetical protein
VPGNDPFTKVMLHLDQVAGSSFTDSNFGGSAHTWTAHNTAAISTAQSEFGGGSLLTTGASDFLTTPDSADFTVGSGSFTAECWFNRQGGDGTNRILFGQGNAGATGNFSYLLGLTPSNQARFAAFSTDGVTAIFDINSTATYTAAGWHHIAGVRNSSIFTLFIDGLPAVTAVSTALVADSSTSLSVGTLGELPGSVNWNGYIDEVRLSVGIARWTSSFTPQQQAYDTYTGFKITEYSDTMPTIYRKTEIVSY